jgi:hypothetical protein
MKWLKIEKLFFFKKYSLTLCQTTMLWSMAHPQSTIPTLITILVVMAGVEGN